jgi:hypothetical protein
MILELEKLLGEFEKIEKPNISNPTFLEIAGYPHYENVCSNILSFYFDSRGLHQLDDLLIQSILNCVKFDFNEKNINTINVTREVFTNEDKRIDIVIECEDVVIAIENKIWAPIYNDLNIYSKFIDEKFNNERVKIVLSVLPVFENFKSGFLNITYQMFFDELKNNIGTKIIQAHPKYLTLLTDFIESILNLTKPDEMNKEMLNFFIEEKERVLQLIDEKSKLDSFILKKIKKVQSLINLDILANTNQWIWQKHDLVHDIEIEKDVIIAVDCYFEYEGIGINVWVRRGSVNKSEYLKNLMLYPETVKVENERLVIQTTKDMKLLTPDEKIAEKLNDVLTKIKTR